MKIILLKSIPKLGSAGDLVDVSPAYARNVLLKNNSAKPATTENINQYKQGLQKKKKAQLRKHESLNEAYKKLKNAKITFLEKTSSSGTLFAGIDSKKIAKKLSDTHKIIVDPSHLLLDGHIKSIGSHSVKFKLADNMEGAITVKIDSSKK